MILYLARRYAFPHSASLKSRALRITLTVMLSLVVVIVVIAIMNFLQTSRFDAIRDVRSFDYILQGNHKDEIKSLLGDADVFVYGEGEAITSSGSYLIRYIDNSYDGGLRFYLGDTSSLVIPLSFYRKNGSGETSLYMLRSGERVTGLKNVTYRVSGIYYTALGSEFDDTMLFLPIEEADENVTMKTAVRGITEKEASLLVENGYTLTSWKDEEKSLYGAFLVEKALMYGVLSLLFIIIAVSTKSSVVLFFDERAVEMAELEILGLEKKMVRRVAVLSFLIVMMLGIILGLIAGHIVLSALEKFSASSSAILSMTLTLPYGGFSFFSLFMIVITLLFTRRENIKREKKEIIEVIHER